MSGLSRDDVLRMAEEAGITNELIVSGWGEHWIDMPIQLERFANLVAAAEREACAEACDELVLEHPGRADLTAKQCAFAIRARGSDAA